jgi:ribosomal protein S13
MEEILAIQGIGEKTAEKLIEEAKALHERRGRELAEETARAAAETARAAEASARAALEPQLESPDEASEPVTESTEAEAAKIVEDAPKKTGALFEESARLRHGAELDEDEEVAERVEAEEDFAPEEAAVKERDPDEVGVEAPGTVARAGELEATEDEDTNETRDDAS